MRNLFRLAAAAGVATATVVGFASGAYAASGTATPNSGLHDQDTVHVTGTGFPGNSPMHVLECTRGATSSADCEGFTDDPTVTADSSGNYDNPAYTVYTLPDSVDPTASIQCDSTHLCDLLLIANDYNDFTNTKVFVPLDFAAVVTTTTTTVPATTTTTTGGTGAPQGTNQGLLVVGAGGLLGLGVAGARRRTRMKSV